MNKKGGVSMSYKSKADRIREKVKQDLLNQLEQKGLDGEHYNDSCDKILKTNNQMIKILEFLKINPDENIDGSDADEL